ncbi:MAG: hypothetical protein Q7S84_00020 [bacterium]|nr:hypothetical protein [bacterium]
MKEEDFLHLSSWEFDQGDRGWRQFEDGGKIKEAIKLIATYLATHEKDMRGFKNDEAAGTVSLQLLHFHRGQLLAELGEEHYARAIQDFKQAYYGDGLWWDTYVCGTIAFLERNKDELMSTIEKLESEDGVRVNGAILKNLLKSIDSKIYSYRDVYPLPVKKKPIRDS